MKKIVIDTRLAGLENAGIGRYIQSLIEEFRGQSSGVRVQGSGVRVQIQTFSKSIRHYSVQEQTLLISELLTLKPDLVHFPHFNVPLLYNQPFVVTIHDLLWHERVGFSATTLPKWLYLIKYFGYRVVLRHAVLGARAIIVPSQWVKKKVVERFPEAEGKINVIYEGVSDIFRGVSLPRQGDSSLYKKVQPCRGKVEPYLIYTGSLYPHKNLRLVLNVLKHFSDLKLVVACARSVFWEKFKLEVDRRGLEDRVVLAGFVSDEELVELYRRAIAFVFPSLSEGFGLPGLEAMAAGCPVISSTAGALPEIYGDVVAYFDPRSDRDLRKEIDKVREDGKYREELIRRGRERSKQFTWERCAQETLEVYQRVLKTR